MDSVRAVANAQRAVFVTIHQPSINIFEAFDFLMLLQRGGRTTYFGPLGEHSSELIAYLEGVPGARGLWAKPQTPHPHSRAGACGVEAPP